MKTFLTLLSLFVLSSLCAAQEFPQLGLPDGAKLRLGNGKITQIQYSPDGTRLAVGTGIGIWIYDTSNRKEAALFAAHAGVVWCLAYSPDGSVLASGSSDGTIRFWNASTGAHLRTLEGHTSRIIDVIFSRDGSTLGSVDFDNTVRFWDTLTGEEERSFDARTQEDMSSRGVGAVFSPNSTMLASWILPTTTLTYGMRQRENICAP